MTMQLQTTGYLTKEEELQTFEAHIIPGTLVFETKAPYPGYFGSNLPHDDLPECFYIVLAENLTSRRIFRLNQQLNEYADNKFEASPSDLMIHTNTYRAIRLRGIGDYSTIENVQHGLIDQGFKLMKSKKINATARIRLEKYFTLEEWDNIGYRDKVDAHMSYITLPKHLSWSQFRSLTFKLKNNLDTLNFDIAYAELQLGHMVDTVRVYSHHISFEELKEIKEKYLRYIK